MKELYNWLSGIFFGVLLGYSFAHAFPTEHEKKMKELDLRLACIDGESFVVFDFYKVAHESCKDLAKRMAK